MNNIGYADVNQGWDPMSTGDIDLNTDSALYTGPGFWTGSGTYDDIIYTTQQTFVCGFVISASSSFSSGIGIDGFLVILCHQDVWEF